MQGSDNILFIGTYHHTLDDKNRLTLPSSWRFEGDGVEHALIGFGTLLNCITVYPSKTAPKIDGNMDPLGMLTHGEQAMAIMRQMALAAPLSCDGQGRVILPENLRDHAHLAKDAVLVGTMQHFNIWSRELFEKLVLNPKGGLARNAVSLKKHTRKI